MNEFKRLKIESEKGSVNTEFLHERVRRINRYFEALTHSFNIMVDGMDQAEFLQFKNVTSSRVRVPVRSIQKD